MSEKDDFNREDLIKSLMDASDCSREEAEEMIVKSDSENTDLEKSKKAEETEDEYSEETEKEMEKAMNAAKEAYDTYKSKKPQVQKSENNDLGSQKEPENNDLLKSMETMFGGLKESFGEKFESIEKSNQESLNSMKEQMDFMKSQIEEIGNYTPSPKMEGLTNEAIIEKAMDGGVQEDGKLHLSKVKHKDQISVALGELAESESGDMQKSLEVDLSNYCAGGGSLGDTAKRILAEKKNIIVH